VKLSAVLQISFSEEMVGFFDFLFVRMSFLGVRNSKNSDFKFFVLVPYFILLLC